MTQPPEPPISRLAHEFVVQMAPYVRKSGGKMVVDEDDGSVYYFPPRACEWCADPGIVWDDSGRAACGPHHENLVLRAPTPV